MTQYKKRLPIILQVIIYGLHAFLFAHFLYVKDNYFWEADFSDTSRVGSIICCLIFGMISGFAVLWLIGKIFGKDSSIVINLLVSFLVILLTCTLS
jgi:hypothetical protein